MNIKNPDSRLQKFWGKVDLKHVTCIGSFVKGINVLDMGCGYGTTTNYLTKQNFNCIGIDYDLQTVEKAKKRFTNCNFLEANAEALPFENNYFDTIVLRDALHHFVGEADFDKVKKEILRVSKPNAIIIFFDPNVHFLLKTMRKLSNHIDEECKYEDAITIMDKLNCKVNHKSFNTIYSLPLSGGYVGINFVPNASFVHGFVLKTELFFEKIVNSLKLGRYLCWRYVIVGQRV